MLARTKQTWVIGLFTLLVVALAVLGYQFLKGRELFNRSSYYYAYFNDIGGLYVTNRVVINGLSVGYVSDLRFANDGTGRILAQFRFPKELKLQQSTTAKIVNAGLIGGSIVRLQNANGNGPLLQPGDTLQGYTETPYTEALSAKVAPLFDNVDTVVIAIKQFLRTAQNTLTPERTEDIYFELHSLLRNLRATSAALPATVEQLNRSVTQVTQHTDSIQHALTSLIDSIHHPLKTLILRTDSLLIASTNIAREIQNGNGTVGKLIKSDSLYYELRTSVRTLDSVLTEVQRNPKRYFNFSIF